MRERKKPQPGEPDDRAHEIADALRGTCLDLMAEATDAEADDTVLMSQLDELVFECDGCGWWFDIEEIHDGELCTGCNNKEEDE